MYMYISATNHITANPGTLRSVFNTSAYPSVTVSGSFSHVTKLGNGILPSSSPSSRPLHLNNVLVCHSIIKNHVSVVDLLLIINIP